MDAQTAREMALDMPGTAEKERFGRPSYSVKKKGYMTHWIEEDRAVMKLTLEQQTAFHEAYPDSFSPLSTKLGKYGWTNVYIHHLNERLFRYALDLAWRNAAPKWLTLTRQAPPKP